MSFAAIRNTAYSSLMTTQIKMQVASSNIANADTAGYTRKTAKQALTATGGLGTGVAITGVTSAVNKFLLKDIAKAVTALGSASTSASYAMELQSLFGSISSGSDQGGTSLAHALSALESALNQLTVTPESDTLKTMAVSALEAVAVQLRETSTGIQALRGNADNEIVTAVGTVNSALHTIDLLNKQITHAAALGEPTADLEDMRNTALQSISQQMDVQHYVNNFGEMKINTGSGTPMLDSQVHELRYSGVPVVTAGTDFTAAGTAGITIEGKSIKGEVTGGKIGALIDMRDNVLPSVQKELDELAKGLINTLNSTYNKATAMPAPTVMTGSKTTALTDALAGTGTMRIARMGADGKVAGVLDIDLGTLATVDDLVNQINTTPGLGLTASVVGGKLVLSAPAGQGVAVTDIDSQIGGKGVSDYFGLNDLMSGDSATTIRVRPDILSTPSILSNATLSKDPALAVGNVGLSISSSFLQSLSDQFKLPQGFSTAGTLGATTTSFADYAGNIVAHAATTATKAELNFKTKQTGYETLASAMASQTGVNIDEETGMLSELKQQYSTAAQIFEALNAMYEALLQAARSA